jgi:hypothetical protein
MRHSIQSALQIMDLSRFSLEELEELLQILPEEIRRRESVDDEAELRKRRVFLDFQELAAKQGVDLSKL